MSSYLPLLSLSLVEKMSLSSQDPIDVDMTILVSPLVLRVLQDSAQSESAASIPFLQDAAYAVLRILYAVQV